MNRPTADLADEFGDRARVAEPLFQAYGGLPGFSGAAVTLRVPDDNSLVRAALLEEGAGQVLVVDGGGHVQCALLGGNLARLASENGWAGIWIHGCVRDVDEIAAQSIGVRALSSHPRKSVKRGLGERGVTLEFAGVCVSPGDLVVADADGLVVMTPDG